MAKYRLKWDTGEPWKEKQPHYWCSVVLLPQCQALTSSFSLPHSCWATCSDDQSHTHTCCKFHSALTWHFCQRKHGISMAGLAHSYDFSVTQTQGDTAAEILITVSKPSASGVLNLPNLSVTAGSQSSKHYKVRPSMHCMIFNLEIVEFLFESLQQYYRG